MSAAMLRRVRMILLNDNIDFCGLFLRAMFDEREGETERKYNFLGEVSLYHFFNLESSFRHSAD